MPDELLILYNASGSLLGHVAYGYHHIAKTKGKDCSACLLTHGPSLSMSESPAWCDARSRIEGKDSQIKVKQLHTDEIGDAGYLKDHELALPVVLLRREQGGLSTVFTKEEMDGFNGDHAKFEQALETKLEQT